jgi:hypothetical protein
MWQASMNEPVKWWQVDFENIYTVSEVRLLFPSVETGTYKIELSKDDQNWITIAHQNESSGKNERRIHVINKNEVGRFLRITFSGSMKKPISINEVEVLVNPLIKIM